ncbi:MAG: DUF3618 domain-containing protein [Pseudomonadota bacterium]|nr:DUF3618 domain-containing protein [Pseudomonadota bacterium]
MTPDVTDRDTDNMAGAKQRSERARQQLAQTLVEIQNRLNPKVLAREAAQEIRQAGEELARDSLEVAKRHPLTLAGVAAGVGLFLARKPLRHLIGTQRETTPPPKSSPLKPGNRGKRS